MAIAAKCAPMYTARVPEPPEIKPAYSIKEVRNKLGPIIEAARYFDRVTYMTNRGVPVAAVVSVELARLAEEVGGTKALIELVRVAREGRS